STVPGSSRSARVRTALASRRPDDYRERMGHIDLRNIDDDDLDAVFEMMRDPEAVALAAFTADDPDDREAFDAWAAGERAAPDVQLFTVTDRGGFAGTAALFTVDG